MGESVVKAFLSSLIVIVVISAAAAVILDGVDSSTSHEHQSRFGSTRL